MTEEFRLFAHELPKEKSFVNFEFTERQEHSLSCKLIDYNMRASMPLQCLTRKKKLRSLNKMTPLNKPMIGWVEEVTLSDIIISIAYIEVESEPYLKFKENSTNNNFLKSLFLRYCTKHNKNMIQLWNDLIHPLDLERISTNELSLYDYVLTKYTNKNWGELELFITEQVQSKKSADLLRTKFKLVSVNGVDYVKDLISTTLTELKLDLDVFLDHCPNYTLISKKSSVTNEDHTLFLNNLKKNESIFVSF